MILLYCSQKKIVSCGYRRKKTKYIADNTVLFVIQILRRKCDVENERKKMRQQPDGIQNKQQITKICKQTSKCNQNEQCLSSITATMYPKKWSDRDTTMAKNNRDKDIKRICTQNDTNNLCYICKWTGCICYRCCSLSFSYSLWFFIFVDKVLWPKVMGQKLFRFWLWNSLWVIIWIFFINDNDEYCFSLDSFVKFQ